MYLVTILDFCIPLSIRIPVPCGIPAIAEFCGRRIFFFSVVKIPSRNFAGGEFGEQELVIMSVGLTCEMVLDDAPEDSLSLEPILEASGSKKATDIEDGCPQQ
jgi:hypothetical protein